MRTRRILTNVLRAVVLLAFTAGTGCIFEVRDAAPPDSGSTWVVPDDPQRVFQNMKTGLEDRTGANYFRSLNDAFAFNPTATDSVTQPPGTYDNWTVDVEKDVTDNILANASTVVVNFTDRVQIQDTSVEVKFDLRYELILTDAISGTDTSYKGAAQFTMVNGSKGWQLSRWRDTEAESGFATWGFLRGTNRTP